MSGAGGDPNGVEGSYSPGSWTAVATETGWLLAALPAADPRVGELWQVLRAARDADAALEVLLGAGLTALPGFALVTLEDTAARIVVRRPAWVHVEGPDVSQHVEATAATWSDVSVPLPLNSMVISSGEPAGDVALPVGLGVMQAAAITLSWDHTALPPAPVVDSRSPGVSSVPAVAEDLTLGTPGLEDPDADTASDYSDLFAGTANRAAFLDRLAAQVQQGDDEGEESESEPANATAVWHTMGLPTTPSNAPAYPGAPSSATPTPRSGLIDGVPWAAGPTPQTPAPTSPPTPVAPSQAGMAPPTAPLPASTPAPSSPLPSPPPTSAATDAPDTNDRDELDVHTMSRAELLAMSASSVIVGPSVLAVRCPAGHLTPPFSPGCRICSAPVDPSDPTRIPRPPLGVLRREGGDPVLLDRDIVLGRAPQPPAHTAQDAATQPNLVRIADPGISRSHVHVALDGWQVFVRDLGSSNGTELHLPGQPPETLRANEDYLAEPGSKIVLAGDVVFTYEVGG